MKSTNLSVLPEPDLAARDHSSRVTTMVRGEIVRSGGWITFADYMQLVLYAPGLGYYVAGARKFGGAGDFVTAPETTPLFARALAAQVAPVLAATAARELVEFGAGSGALAADLMNALARSGALPSRYAILDVSPDLRRASARGNRAPRARPYRMRRMARCVARDDRRRRRDERSARRDPARISFCAATMPGSNAVWHAMRSCAGRTGLWLTILCARPHQRDFPQRATI